MKNNRGMGHIKTIILTLIIAASVAGGVYYVRMQYGIAKIKTIRTNMSLIELKAEEYLNKQKAEGKEETNYIGTKLSEIKDNEIVSDLISKGVVTEEECEKYYMLSDEDLISLSTNVYNEKDSFYLINYETWEVIITSGCRLEGDSILYKLSDIEAADEGSETQNSESEEVETQELEETE